MTPQQFVEMVARMETEEEMEARDGGPMESDDTYDTVHSLIRHARGIETGHGPVTIPTGLLDDAIEAADAASEMYDEAAGYAEDDECRESSEEHALAYSNTAHALRALKGATDDK